MGMSNREILRKAEMAVTDLSTDGGYLPSDVARTFMRNAVKSSEFLKMIRVQPMKSHTYKEPQITINSRILHAASSGVPLSAGNRSKPTTDEMELASKEYKCEAHIPYDVLEDNVEEGKMQATILSLMKDQVGRDMEEVVIQSDTTSDDADLAQQDGLFKLATTNTTNAGGATMDLSLLHSMLKALPVQFKKKAMLRYFVSPTCEDQYRYYLANRATGGGDRWLDSDQPLTPLGIKLKAIPMFPEDLGGGSNYASALLTNPLNCVMGVWKKIKFEFDKDISAGTLFMVGRVRIAVNYSEEAGVSIATSILAT